MAASDAIAARHILEAVAYSFRAGLAAIAAWDRLTGPDERVPIPAMRQELDACQTPEAYLAWAERWLEGRSGGLEGERESPHG